MKIRRLLKDSVELYILPAGVLALALFVVRRHWEGTTTIDAASLAMSVWVELIAIAFFFEDIAPALVLRRELHMSRVGGVLAIAAGLLSLRLVANGSIWWGVGGTEAIGSLVLACALLASTHADHFRAIISLLWIGLWLGALFFVTARERGSDFVLDLALDLAAVFMGLWLVHRYATRIIGSARPAET
jgi:hypothetical protein